MSVNVATLVARQPDVSPANSKVCRCLFGEVDHDDLKRTLDNGMDVINRQKSDMWGFDFKTERPLPGGCLDWKRVVAGDENVPVAYALSGMTSPGVPAATTEMTCPDGKCIIKSESECSQEQRTSTDICKTKRNRSSSTLRKMPDYFRKKKNRTYAKRRPNNL